jgi:CheY-like chemotaxis protein
MVSMPKKILIVEDYAVNRSFVKFLLEEDGYEVLEAENGLIWRCPKWTD